LKQLFFLIAAVAVLNVFCGCAGTANVENARNLRVGMTKAQVLEIMGDPISDETFCKPDVWFYQIRSVWADGLTTEDECVPLVFADGILLGWGNEFYAHHRMNKVNAAGETKL
jgi:hypothetical protein